MPCKGKGKRPLKKIMKTGKRAVKKMARGGGRKR